MRTVQCIALASLATLASPAFAQPATDKIKIEISRAELQAIGNGVMKLPYEIAQPILADLQRQLSEHDAAAKADSEKTEKPAAKK